MAGPLLVLVLIVGCALSPSNGLKCHEGFNMTLNGMPLYFWNERTCSGESKCIGQEIAIDTAVIGSSLRTALRYGACMSSTYADYLDCSNLFGADSTFDPANLLDIIPEISSSITSAVDVFTNDLAASLTELLSDGTGMESFVDGVFTFYGNLGFNLTKATPLKPSLVKLLKALISGSETATNSAVREFFNDFAQLDTENHEFAAALRSILATSNVNMTSFEANTVFVVIIERGPGLLRSIFPSDWQVALWYDVAFKIIGNIDSKNWTKSTEDMVATIKSSYPIPDNISPIVNPIFDALPDLARGSEINPSYVGNWSLGLLEKFSEEDSATKAFSNALSRFLGILGTPLQYEFKAAIKWMPGLFYKFFHDDKAVIQNVYMKMADGFNSFNFTNIATTAPETELSTMIKNLVTTISGSQYFDTSTPEGGINNALVVNFAKMFYDLMNVTTTDYTGYIDKFATAIDDELAKGPNINVGSMVGKLITEFGGQIPTELAPMLENVQNILMIAMEQPLNGTKLLEALYRVTASYKSQYPESPFPDLVDRYINLMFQLVTIDYSDSEASAKVAEINLEIQLWNIDLQFAIVKSMNYTSDQLHQMLTAAWPEFDLLIRALRALDHEDVKQLIKDIVGYLAMPAPHTTQGFVDAVKPTFQKLTKSIETLMREIRRSFSPNECQFASCMDDLCNDQGTISAAAVWTPKEAMTQSTPAVTEDMAPSTTSSGNEVSFNILLNIATTWVAVKSLFQGPSAQAVY